jgi:hypothetical protein
MSTIRFALLAIGLFALAFIGVSWLSKGAPVVVAGVAPLKPNPRLPTFSRVPSPLWGNEHVEVSEEMQKRMREDWETSKTSQSDGNGERDKLRGELLQAANAYALSPCDNTIKRNLVEAHTNYTRAWQAIFYCRPGAGDCPAKQDDRIDRARAAFHTPADVRVHEALQVAFDQGGIVRDDFPQPVRKDVHVWVRPAYGEPKAACIAARQAMEKR